MLESFTDLVSSSPVTYLVVLALVAADAIIPAFPGESSVVAAAVLAADGELVVWLVGAAGALGAFAGDLGAYLLGRLAGQPVLDRFVRGEKGKRRLERARKGIHRHGVLLVVSAQFVPGGRNLVMLAAGTARLPLRLFLLADAAGAVLWASFQTSLGYFGGQAFDSTLTSLLVSLAAAAAVGLLISAVELVRRRRSGARGGAPAAG